METSGIFTSQGPSTVAGPSQPLSDWVQPHEQGGCALRRVLITRVYALVSHSFICAWRLLDVIDVGGGLVSQWTSFPIFSLL